MLKVTSEAFHEKLKAGNDEIILNGPPSKLRGHIYLNNQHNEAVSVKELLLVHNEHQRDLLGERSALRVSTRLKPGETKMEPVMHQLPSYTPPGTYESKMMIGGTEQTVKMIVQPNISINITPTFFTFEGTHPGTTHTAVVTLTNTGNIRFKVPDVKHIAALDMDLICRALGVAIRDKGAEGYESVLNEISRNINQNIPDWAGCHIEENGTELAPGATMLLHLHITLPKNTDAAKDYAGNLRFWDEDIAYVIKSHY
jgi:hypothetical protein